MKTSLKKPESRKLSLNRETLAPLQTMLYAEFTAVVMASAVAGGLASYLACR